MASGTLKLWSVKQALATRPDQLVDYVLGGRVNNFRSYRKCNFIDLVDGSSINKIQVVISKDLLKKPELGSYLVFEGKLLKSRGPQQDVEFNASSLKYHGSCDPSSYPLATTDDLSDDWFRRSIHLRPRAQHFASLLRIRSELEFGLQDVMRQMNFFRVHTPSLSANDSEASSDLFLVDRTALSNRSTNPELDNVKHDEESVDRDYLPEEHSKHDKNQTRRVVKCNYFNKDVFLISSAQLHLENLAGSLSKVYTISTAFRAENSLTRRHLCEFLMFEAEESNLTDLETLMDRVELVIKYAAKYLSELSEHKSDVSHLIQRNSNIDNFKRIASSPYIRMTYGEALEILKDKTDFAGDTQYGSDIGTVQERKLLDYCANVPIFITNYPKQCKPFYMKCDIDNREAECFDLIAPHGGEICGGSLREDDQEKLLENLKSSGLADHQLRDLSWYIDIRRYGSFPHGGFGIGFERLLQSLLGIKNIKDTTAFPRWAGRCPM